MGYVRIAFTDEGSQVEVETADDRVNGDGSATALLSA